MMMKWRCNDNVSTRGRRWWERRKGDATTTCQLEAEDDEKEEREMQQWCVCSFAVSMVQSWQEENATMMYQCHCNIHGKETLCVGSGTKSMAKKQKENKQEKKVWPNLYAMHAKHVITIPKNIQLTHKRCGWILSPPQKPKINHMGWLWAMILQQMKPL